MGRAVDDVDVFRRRKLVVGSLVTSKKVNACLHLLDSPVGTLFLTAEEGVLTGVYFEQHLPNISLPDVGKSALLARAALELGEYFQGQRTTFSVPHHGQGTMFQQRVWAGLATIPYGETRTYGQLAAHLSQPTASRAVGMANNRNPLSIIVPCHRVIGAGGKLVGYGGGLAVKEWLLQHERRAAPIQASP
jgi:methylated-DNA-[protein]-cysteine S-methyltransferase